MRPMIKSLLFTCAVCAVAQGTARAQPTTPPPSPTGQPSPNNPGTVPPIEQPSPTTSPSPTPDPTIPQQPAPIDPANQVPAPTTTDPATTNVDVTITPPPAPVDVDANVDVDIDADVGPGMYSYAWHDEALQSGIGVSTILGGGVAGFTDTTMRDTTSDVGGLWNLRVTLGSHIPLGIDLSYLGTATNINGLPGGQSGTLIGTTVEGALRYNMLPHHIVTPYLFAGVGWQRYDVAETNVSLSDSGMNDRDNLLEFPMGAGLGYRMNGFVGELRGTFRAATEQNLVLRTASVPGSPTSDDFAPMHTWEASAALGYEF
jgi:hypothetical protein